MKKIYIVLTDTNSVLSRIIRNYTKDKYNHISIALDPELKRMYSFGRKYENSPWLGGFIKENVHSKILYYANTEIFELEITKQQYIRLKLDLMYFKQEKENLQYNFFGLLALALNIPLKRTNAYFCSEFIATLFVRAGIAPNLEPHFTSPMELVTIPGLKSIYKGRLHDYIYVTRSTKQLGTKAV